ncbi:Fe-S cluster assembly protein SufD [Cecembia calidifontis]|jgi:Fe-S cluster assembly protein SufD|uniref:Iron-regulated ABC transporter permease protein SufD n=1 Tax=Cecembia calidifontis TaxID=1187080 RepID=A0A4Q7P945_9BACT|nr:Fe-S cluster assembly protein SufD [Cecembia calidifontis]RZS96661.1 iron-regulated ABC transporter permease protein SufD [Cecembia calidifontis]
MTTLTKNKIADQIVSEHGLLQNFDSLREKAIAFLTEKGLPAPKEEEYKFTAITKKLEQSIQHYSPAKPIDLTEKDVQRNIFGRFDGDVLVFNNGQFSQELSRLSGQDYQLSLLSQNTPSEFGKIAKLEKDPFVALNTATFQDGVHIQVGRNKKIEKPIFFLFFNKANEGQVITSRLHIVVEDNAEVTFLGNSVSMDENAYFSNAVTEIKVAQNAHVHFSRLQNENKKAVVVDNFETDIHRDATFTSTVISLSGDMVRNNLSLNLLDSGCEGNMFGLYLLNGKTHVDNHTNVDHTKPHAESNELYKGILADQSRGVFNGKIFVRQDAQKTNAFQQNNNILLSEDATVNTKPQLEIWADDVKCSHGCTTGQLDEEALFYLQARGLGKEQAKGLLLYAFAGEVLDKISDEHFRDYVTEIVQERLGGNQ